MIGQRYHFAKIASGDQSHGGGTEPQGQQAIEGDGIAAPLQMAKYQMAGLLPGLRRYFSGDLLGDTTQQYIATGLLRFPQHLATQRRGAFRHNHDTVMAPRRLPLHDFSAYRLQREG